MAQKKIFVVDDDADNVMVLKTRLEAAGYAVEAAYDGEEALSKVEAVNPDLIILDVMMPKKDGYEALVDLHHNETTVNIPVVMLTARREGTVKNLFALEKAAAFLEKPVDLKKLLIVVEEILKKSEKT